MRGGWPQHLVSETTVMVVEIEALGERGGWARLVPCRQPRLGDLCATALAAVLHVGASEREVVV